MNIVWRWLLIGITTIVMILVAISWALLQSVLLPEGNKKGKDIASSWVAVEKRYPKVKAWRDSLQQHKALRDTFLKAPDGATLHAYYIRHPQATRTAIVVHGYGENAVDMMHFGRMYERDLGMNVVLPDLRYAGLSEGTHIQMGWHDRHDLLLWENMAANMFGLQPDKNIAINGYIYRMNMVVHGRSMGAAAVLMSSGDSIPEYIGGFIADCPYTCVWEEFAYQLWKRHSLPTLPFLYIASTLSKARYGWNFREASAYRQVKRNEFVPTLFIHGEADDFVPTDMGRRLYEAAPCIKQWWSEKGVGHATMYDQYPEEYLRRVRAFIDTYCGEYQVVKMNKR